MRRPAAQERRAVASTGGAANSGCSRLSAGEGFAPGSDKPPERRLQARLPAPQKTTVTLVRSPDFAKAIIFYRRHADHAAHFKQARAGALSEALGQRYF